MACVVGTWWQAVGVSLFAMLVGFIIKIKIDHPV